MSLSRLALRIITARALAGNTLAGTRVFDSAVEPIDLQVQTQREPFLIVMTDDHDRQVSGRDLRHGTDSCELVIEVAVATTVKAGAGGTEEVVVPHTDAGMEVVLDLIGQQINETLMAGQGTWAKLWRDFAMRTPRIMSRRGASAENGVRFAARQIIITCDTLADPIRGEPIPMPWQWLFTAMEADPEMEDLAALIRYAIEGDAALTPEALFASTYGLNEGTITAMGETPVRDEDGIAVPVGEITIDTENGDWVITDEEA